MGSSEGESDSGVPTEPDPCPGIDDSCIWDSQSETKQKFQCAGQADATLSAEYQGAPLMFSQSSSFVQSDEVIACCDDNEYVEGCMTINDSPHAFNCLRDCAQQSCLKLFYEVEEFVDQIPNAQNDLKTQAINVQNYIALHIDDCADALRMNVLCGEVEDNPENCVQPSLNYHGVWVIPDDPQKWPDATNLRVEGTCSVNDWMPVTGESCQGGQGNNEDPFPDPPPMQPLQPMRAPIVHGTVSTFSLQSGFESASFVAKDVRYRQEPCLQGQFCQFKLDSFSAKINNLNLGKVKLTNLAARMLWVASGKIQGTNAVIPHAEIDVNVTGKTKSQQIPEFDDMQIDSTAVSVGPALLHAGEHSFGITYATFVVESQVYVVTTSMAPCAPDTP